MRFEKLIPLFVFLFSACGHAADDIVERGRIYENDIQQIIANNTSESVETHLQKVSEVLVFLSFSMPEKSLEDWLRQCKKTNATPVIRGLIDNSFQKTMLKLTNLSQKTGTGVQLDPVLFKFFDIEQVPAVVVVNEIPKCPQTMQCIPVAFSRMYGNVTLDYALEKMRGEP